MRKNMKKRKVVKKPKKIKIKKPSIGGY